MALDPYSSCPCGSGKKFKWCCQPIFAGVNRAFEQEAQGQHETALRLMDEVVAENPGNPEAWGRMAELLYRNDKVQEAEAALAKAFEISPNYAAGFLLQGLFRLGEGEVAGALILFRRAADAYDPEAHDPLSDVYAQITTCELRLNRPVAARAALRIAMHHDPANEELRKAFEATFGPEARLPQSARKEYQFLPPAAGATGERRAAWEHALAGAGTGRLTDAAQAFEKLAGSDAKDAAALYNLALARAWLGENVPALDALDQYVALEPDEEKAAAAWTLGEVLRCGHGMEERADYVDHSVLCQVRDPRPVVAALQEWQREGRLIVVQADEQGTSLTALLLEAPSGLITSTGGAPRVLRLGAYLFLGAGLLRLSCVNKEWLDGVKREVWLKLGASLSEAREGTGPPLFSDVVINALTFPVGIADETQAQGIINDHAAKYFEDTWIHKPLRSLNNTAPVDAAGHATLRKKLRGVVQFLEDCAARGAMHTYDFNRLRRKLGLLGAAEPAVADTVGDIPSMGAPELAALAVDGLSDQQLEQAYQAAQRLDAHELGRHFVEKLIARAPSPEKTDRFPWYSYLVQRALTDGRMDAALDLVNDGEKADCEHNGGQRRNDYEFRRGQVHAKRGEADQAGDVFQRLIDREPMNLKYRGSAAETMLSLKQPAKALHFAEEGLKTARQLNDRDSEGYLMELVAAAKKQGT
jgi:tetratricopeptide (TPR) repeat protein